MLFAHISAFLSIRSIMLLTHTTTYFAAIQYKGSKLYPRNLMKLNQELDLSNIFKPMLLSEVSYVHQLTTEAYLLHQSYELALHFMSYSHEESHDYQQFMYSISFFFSK